MEKVKKIFTLVSKNYFTTSFFVFLIFISYYSCCLSKDFTEVDGPPRCFSVYHSPKPFIHENNHLLYPINIYLWNHGISQVLGETKDFLTFGIRSQYMNAFCMSATISIFYLISVFISKSRLAAALGTLGLGFSKAFILHGTNAAEPVVGLLWSILSLFLATCSVRYNVFKYSAALFSGIFLALAMATYQSMVLIGLGILGISLISSPENNSSLSFSKGLTFLTGCALGAIFFFGGAYLYDGATSISEILNRFFALQGGGVYGGFSISKTINLFMGFVTNQFLTPQWSGFRYYFKNDFLTLWTLWILVVGLISIVFLFLVIKSFLRSKSINKTLKTAWVLGFTVCLLGPLGWDPVYDKLWLQPLMLIWFCALLAWNSGSNFTKYSIVCCAILTVVPNLFWGYLRNPVEYKYVQPALETIEQIKPNDIIVTDWNPITIMAMSVGISNETFPIISYAHDNPKGVTEKLIQLLEKSENNKARLIFFGILDQPRETWDPFLGKRCGLPYEDLNSFRCSSTVLRKINYQGISLSVFAIDYQKFKSTKNDS